MKNNLGRIALIAVAIIWGSGFVASALALDFYSPYQILALRLSIAFVISLAVYYKDLQSAKNHDFMKGSIIGVFLFFAFLFQTIGLQYTTASKNAFFTAINVVIVPFLSWILMRERIDKKSILGALVSLLGVTLLSVDINNLQNLINFNKGDILTIVCAIFFALQIFYTSHFVKETRSSIIMIAQMGTASLLSWIFVLLTRQIDFVLTIQSLLPILYLGLISTMVAYGLQTWAQNYTTSMETAIILSTEALFGMIASAIILGEAITFPMIIGGALLFLGILVVEIDFTIIGGKSE